MALTKVTQPMIEGPPVNVLTYGADPSGVADSTAAFNAAIATGYTVLVPDGTYKVTTLTLQSNAKLIGSSWNAVIKSSTSDVISLLNTSGCVFENLTFDHTNAASNYFFVFTSGADRTTINNCRFINCNTAIYGSSSISLHPKHVSITNNLFVDCKAALYVFISSFWTVTNNRMISGATYAMERALTFLGARNNTVSNNEIYGSTTTTFTGILFLYNSTNCGYFNSCFNTVSNNTIRGITEEALSFDESNSIFIDGGTATSGANTALTDSTKAWATDAYVNYYLVIVAGTGAGEYQVITTNSATTLTVNGRWSVNPDATSVYIITPAFVGNTVIGNTIQDYVRNAIVLYGPCIANIIDGNNVSDGCTAFASTDILCAIEVWGVHRGSTGNPANDRQPAFHNIVTNNTITNTNAQGSATLRPGITVNAHDAPGGGTINWQVLGNVVKGNTIGVNVNPGIYLNRAAKSVVTDNVSLTRSGSVYLSGTNETENRIANNTIFSASAYRVGATTFGATVHGARSNTTSPIVAGVVPFYIGEEFLETATPKWYRSTGLTAADWVALN